MINDCNHHDDHANHHGKDWSDGLVDLETNKSGGRTEVIKSIDDLSVSHIKIIINSTQK